MATYPAPIPLFFWRAASGREPVREWLRTLPREDRHRIGDGLREIQFSWPLGMPLVKPLGGDLWEARVDISGHRAARLMFGFDSGAIVVLHAFIKKTQQAPATDLDLGRRRLKELKT